MCIGGLTFMELNRLGEVWRLRRVLFHQHAIVCLVLCLPAFYVVAFCITKLYCDWPHVFIEAVK